MMTHLHDFSCTAETLVCVLNSLPCFAMLLDPKVSDTCFFYLSHSLGCRYVPCPSRTWSLPWLPNLELMWLLQCPHDTDAYIANLLLLASQYVFSTFLRAGFPMSRMQWDHSPICARTSILPFFMSSSIENLILKTLFLLPKPFVSLESFSCKHRLSLCSIIWKIPLSSHPAYFFVAQFWGRSFLHCLLEPTGSP